MQYVVKCCKHYYGLSMAVKHHITVHASWSEEKYAGKDWYYVFMESHKQLSLRTTEQTSLNRVKAFCREDVEHFFSNLDAVREKYPFAPSQIYNMDETGFLNRPNHNG